MDGFYEGALSGKPAELKELSIQYADFVMWQKEWQKEENLNQHLQYWKEELSGELPVLQLPMDRPRPAVQNPSWCKSVLNSGEFPTGKAQRFKSARRMHFIYDIDGSVSKLPFSLYRTG